MPHRLVGPCLLSTVLLALISGCGSGGGGGGSGSKDNVVLFTSRSALTQATGANSVEPRALFSTLGGPLLLSDGASGSILVVQTNGAPVLLTTRAALTAVTGQTSMSLGPFEQVRTGALSGRLLTADSVSGNLLILDSNGVPSLFTTKAKVTSITGKGNANMRLPRELTLNQIVAQDLETFDLLKFDTLGNPTPFVSAAQLALAAGLAGPPEVAAWARGASTQSLYGRFGATSSVIRVQINGIVSLHVSEATLKALFKDVADLRVLDIEASTRSDALLLLIGEGERGVAIALVSADGLSAGVYVSRSDLRNAAGASSDLSDIMVLPNNIPVLVDRGGGQVLTIGDGDKPVIVGRGSKIREVSGTAAPRLSITASLPDSTAVVFEEAGDQLILVQ